MRVEIRTVSTAAHAYVPRRCWLFSHAGVTSLSHPIPMISRTEMKLNKDTLCGAVTSWLVMYLGDVSLSLLGDRLSVSPRSHQARSPR